MTLYARLCALVHDDARAPKQRLQDAIEAIHEARPRHQFTGLYVVRSDALELAAFAGPPTEHTRIPIGRGLCGRAVRDRRDLDIADVNAEPEYLACSLTTKSEAIALVWLRGEVVGQIDIDSDTPGAFGADAMQSLSTMAHILAPLVAQI
ncbi:MAG: GAF domain-containing protein [Deltaproteobacteria bacterium]|nr:GAF domain-containing protein [Deltaproteobacteria bacterium]